MKMKIPYVLVIIPFKGQTKYLFPLINSFLADSYITTFTWAMVLWDDGTEETELNNLFEEVKKRWPILIVKHNNVGYTQTVHNIFNTFTKLDKRFDYLFLGNSDIKMRPGSLYSLVKRMTINANTAVVGGKILKYGTNEIIHTGTRVENGEIVDPYVGLNMNDPKANFVERRLWVNGCGCLYNLHIMRKQNFNVDLEFSPAYFEEADLMTRMNVLGYSVLYEPRAEIEHVVNATMGTERQKYEQIFWTNWDKYLAKWKPHFQKLEF